MRRFLALTFAFTAACTGSSDPASENTSPTETVVVSGDPQADTDDTVVDGASVEPESASANIAADGSGIDCDQIDRATMVRSRSIAGGRQLHLSLIGDDRRPVVESVPISCLGVRSERLGDLEVVTSPSERSEGATLIVANWTSDTVDTSRAVIDELLATLPPTERVAVWAWSDELIQVVGATDDRALVARRLDAEWTADDAEPLDHTVAADIAAEAWEDYADDVLLGLRSIVFVAPAIELAERPDIDRDVVTDYWIVDTGSGGRVETLADVGPAAPAQAVAGRIEAASDGPLTVVEFCDDGDDLDLTLLSGTEELRTVGVGDSAVEHVGAPCDIESLGAPTSDALPTIDVTFDAEQRAGYDEAVAIADELSGRDRFDTDIDPEWEGNISFDGGVTSAPFEASFRGQSSIECERRNWSIDLEGGDARHPIGSTGSDEFILASLCNDVGYVNTLAGSAVMADFGVWSLATGTATFTIDGEPLGVYLVIENPEVGLRAETSVVESVLRRRYDVLDVAPDVEYVADQTINDEASVLAAYDELVAIAEATSGDEMVDALRGRFDLDQYLRWTAVMSLLGSGDHIDELFFIGEQTVNAEHEPVTWFTVSGWDPDDLYAECHRNGRFEIDDPNGLLSCTEALLDQQLFADPIVYELFVTELEDVVATTTDERFEQITTEATDEVTQHFDDPSVVAAMVELDPPTSEPVVAREAVQAAADGLADEFTERRSTLLDLIAIYRSNN